MLFQTYAVLAEISDILQALRDATSADVHAISPSAQAAVASIEAEAKRNPAKILSVDVYHQEPADKPSARKAKQVDILPERDIRLAHDI